MNTARVQSVQAIADFKAALITFGDDSRQALSMIDVEVRRAVDWLTKHQPNYWRSELRKRFDALGQAKEELNRCRTFKSMDGYKAACTEEKKQVERAQRRAATAEAKVQATKRWSHEVQHEADEFDGRLSQLASMLDGDLPKAVLTLERILRSLDDYMALAAPALPSATDTADAPETTAGSGSSADSDPPAAGAQPAAAAKAAGEPANATPHEEPHA